MSDETRQHRCQRCGSAQRAIARFCDQCGEAFSSAGATTRRLSPRAGPLALLWAAGAEVSPLRALRQLLGQGPGSQEAASEAGAHAGVIPVGEWGVCGDYALALLRALRGVAETGAAALAIEVAYRSRATRPLPCSSSHWMLCDARGYRYQPEYTRALFLGQFDRRLPTEQIEPDGLLRGWIAFPCPLDAAISHARFRPSYAEPQHLLFALPMPEERNRIADEDDTP